MKKLIKIFAISIIVLFLLLATVPILFKKQIKEKVLSGVNSGIDANVSLKNAGISFFSTFPYLAVQLDELSITGKNEFAGVPLFSADRIDLGINIWDAIMGKQPYEIKQVVLDKPNINIQITESGKANYDISKTDTTASSSNAQDDVKLLLKKFQIIDGIISYTDKQSDNNFLMKHLNHELSGDFSSTVTDLNTTAECDTMSLSSGSISYLSNAKLKFSAGIKADLLNNKFTLKENKLNINDLQLNVNGWIQSKTEETVMDMNFSTPDSKFKSLLSLIPGAYTKDFSGVKADGSFDFKARINGTINSKEEIIPSFAIQANVKDGSFKYPTLPAGVSKINANIKIDNKSNKLDAVVTDISKFGLLIGSQGISGRVKLKTPVSNPDMDANIKGKLDLASISSVLPVSSVKDLKGLINADITIKANQKDLDAQRYQNVSVNGKLDLSGFACVYEKYPKISIPRVNVIFSPAAMSANNLLMQLGSSDVSGNFTIQNFLAFFSPTITMKGNVNMESIFLNADEWLSEQAEPSIEPDAGLSNEKPFDQFDIKFNGKIATLIYNKEKISNIEVIGQIQPNEFEFSKLAFQMGQTDINANGNIRNIFSYLYDNQTLAGNINVVSRKIDLNQFMTPETNANKGSTAPEPLLIPDKINMNITGKINQLLYSNMDLKQVSGTLSVKDQSVRIVDASANTLGGTLNLSGGYSSIDPKQPKFDLKTDVGKLDVQQAFKTFSTIKLFAPIAQYIEGKINTNLSISGTLKPDLSPMMETFVMDGFLETLGAVVKNFKPLVDIGNKLNMTEFSNLNLTNTKNWITVKNGAVEVREFDYRMQDIDMKIGGKHSLTNDMAYTIKAKLPRKKLEKNPIGSAVGSGMNFLSKEASKLGLNIQNGEFVNVLISIGGSMLSPKIGFKVLGTDGNSSIQQEANAMGKEAIQKVQDSIKNLANQEVAKYKQKAKEQADKAADSLARLAQQKADEAIKKASEAAKEKLAKEVGDKAGQKAKDEIDKAKDNLKKFDPFKKK